MLLSLIIISITLVASLTGDKEHTASTEKVFVEKEHIESTEKVILEKHTASTEKVIVVKEPTETEPTETEPVEKKPAEDKELKPISNADLDQLAPGRYYRDGKTERTIDFDNKSMELTMAVLGVNEHGYYAEILVA